eukprot:s211_g17.t2
MLNYQRGSYAQRDCLWVQQLKRLGADRQERDELLKTLQLEYQRDELRHWARDLDVLALQEVDEALRRSLDVGDAQAAHRWATKLQGYFYWGRWVPRDVGEVESARHVDGRGQLVDSSCATLLTETENDFSVLRKAHCQLRVPLSHGKRGQFAERDHCGVLLRGRSFQLALCSVHLHPPSAAEAGYLEYLAPLKEMMTSLVADLPDVHLALLGDWNCSAEQLRQLTEADDFWRSFQAVTAAGPTAFETNPCASGDFMLYRGPMQGGHLTWRVAERADGADGHSDFDAFREFGRGVLADSCARLPWLRAASSAGAARKQLRRVEMELQGLLPTRETNLQVAQTIGVDFATAAPRSRKPHRPNAPVRKVLQELLAETSEITAKLDGRFWAMVRA